MIWAYGSAKGSIVPKPLPEAQIIPDLSMGTGFVGACGHTVPYGQ
jgi:hypothetical protein